MKHSRARHDVLGHVITETNAYRPKQRERDIEWRDCVILKVSKCFIVATNIQGIIQ